MPRDAWAGRPPAFCPAGVAKHAISAQCQAWGSVEDPDALIREQQIGGFGAAPHILQ